MAGQVDVTTILGLIEASGYAEARCNGQHHNYTRPGAPTITVSWSNKGDQIPLGTARQIAKDAGPDIENAFKDVMSGGGGKALKKHIKALRKGFGT